MLSELNKPQKVFMIIMYILAGISLMVSCFVIYNLATSIKPETLGTVYASSLSVTDEDINILEVKIHSNENNNGQACYEILWNGYTDYQGGAVKGFGMQSNIKDNYRCSTIRLANGEVIYKELFDVQLYNTDNNTKSSYVVSDIPNELYIDIDGKFYKIKFEEFTYEELSTDGWDFWNAMWGIMTTKTESYNFYSVFDYIIESACSEAIRHKAGEYTLPLLDFSKYFKFYYQDEDTQYKPLDEASTMYEFLKVHVTYSKDGMTEGSQSLFKQYFGNPSWSYYNNTDVEEYWNAYSVVEINENHLNYVEYEGEYCATLGSSFAEYLSKLSNADINVNLNFDNLDRNIFGIDLSNFDFKINSFVITNSSYSSETFKIFNADMCYMQPTLNLGGAE